MTPRWADPEVVGVPCQRPSCGHGRGLHDDVEGCTFCRCGYFLLHDLMTEVRLVDAWRRVGLARSDGALYGWLRVFEGYTDAQARAATRGT